MVDSGDSWQVLCEPSELLAVRDAVETAKIDIDSSGLTMIPNTTVACAGDDAKKILILMEALEDHDDVQKVHANFEIPDEEIAALSD